MKLQDNKIAIFWSTADVQQECEWLTDEQARDVLQAVKNGHNACIGINWDVIYSTAVTMYPHKENQDDEDFDTLLAKVDVRPDLDLQVWHPKVKR